ncbi:MAG: cobalamin-binding protein [Planctomycetota bacterium]
MRIVSLLPAATEMACAIGLGDQLVAVTHECDFPVTVSSLPSVTRTRIPTSASSAEIDRLVRDQLQTEAALYSLDPDGFARAEPDLILTQALCDVCAVAESEVQRAIESLPIKPMIVNLEPNRLEDVLAGLRTIGAAADRIHEATAAIDRLRARIDLVRERAEANPNRPRTLLLEWIDPFFSAGHWNPELIELAGGEPLLGKAGERSRTLTWESLRDADPEILVIACCGFDVPRALQDVRILREQPGWNELDCVRTRRVFVADGSQYFNRPGPRLVDSLEMLAGAIAGKPTDELTVPDLS